METSESPLKAIYRYPENRKPGTFVAICLTFKRNVSIHFKESKAGVSTLIETSYLRPSGRTILISRSMPLMIIIYVKITFYVCSQCQDLYNKRSLIYD